MTGSVGEARKRVLDSIRPSDKTAASGVIDDMDAFALALADLERASAGAAEAKVRVLRRALQSLAVAVLTTCNALESSAEDE